MIHHADNALDQAYSAISRTVKTRGAFILDPFEEFTDYFTKYVDNHLLGWWRMLGHLMVQIAAFTGCCIGLTAVAAGPWLVVGLVAITLLFMPVMLAMARGMTHSGADQPKGIGYFWDSTLLEFALAIPHIAFRLTQPVVWLDEHLFPSWNPNVRAITVTGLYTVAVLGLMVVMIIFLPAIIAIPAVLVVGLLGTAPAGLLLMALTDPKQR